MNISNYSTSFAGQPAEIDPDVLKEVTEMLAERIEETIDTILVYGCIRVPVPPKPELKIEREEWQPYLSPYLRWQFSMVDENTFNKAVMLTLP